jgi:hypothetical protein
VLASLHWFWKECVVSLSRRVVLFAGLAAVLLVSGCGSFRTYYDAPLSAEVTQGWRISAVTVAVPDSLTVSEAATLVPEADIVWREDPPGDRRPQVAAIMEAAVREGAAGLRGNRAVRLEVTVGRFHALTFEAETRLQRSGVHNITFAIQAVDARSGAVLAGPDTIEASFPALSGAEMRNARQRGETQKSQITAHVARVVAGWLGTGPDPRKTFSRAGI